MTAMFSLHMPPSRPCSLAFGRLPSLRGVFLRQLLLGWPPATISTVDHTKNTCLYHTHCSISSTHVINSSTVPSDVTDICASVSKLASVISDNSTNCTGFAVAITHLFAQAASAALPQISQVYADTFPGTRAARIAAQQAGRHWEHSWVKQRRSAALLRRTIATNYIRYSSPLVRLR